MTLKSKKSMMLLAAALSLFVLIVGCRTSTNSDESENQGENPTTPTTKKYTVTFHYNVDGEDDNIKTQVFTEGARQKLTPFAELGYTEPTGKIFGGWVRGTGDGDKDRKADPNVWDNALMELNEDIKLYARYGTERIVTFNVNGGTGSLDNIKIVEEFPMPVVRKGEELTAPTGKEFAGWAETGTKSIIVRTGGNIPAGSFTSLDAIWMGDNFNDVLTGWKIGSNVGWKNNNLDSDNSAERKEVSVSFTYPYALSDHEVTIKEWKDIIKQPLTDIQTNFLRDEGYADLSEVDDFEPMRWVSWYDAIIYCNRLSVEKGYEPCYDTNTFDWQSYKFSGTSPIFDVTCDFSKNGYRLPTEAEWECAIRGEYSKDVTNILLTVVNVDDHSLDSSLNDANELKKRGNIGWNSAFDKITERHKSVMSLYPTYGYYDMLGNVSEWCWDLWVHGYTDGDSRTSNQGSYNSSSSTSSSRVVRGGAFDSQVDGNFRRINHRQEATPHQRLVQTGFRVCRTVTP